MNNKTKIMLGLSALTAGTLAAGATGTLAWFTTNKTATATYSKITAKATQGSIKAKITGITDKTITSSEYTAEATVTSASSYTADVSSTNGINFAQPQWVGKAGNDQAYNKVEDVSNKENYFTQYFITLQNDGDVDMDIYLDAGCSITGDATLTKWTRVAIITNVAEADVLQTTKDSKTFLFQNSITEGDTKYVAATDEKGDKLTLVNCDPTPVSSFVSASTKVEGYKNNIVKQSVTKNGGLARIGVSVWMEGTMTTDVSAETNQDLAKGKSINVKLCFAAEEHQA